MAIKMYDGTKLAYVAFKRCVWLLETALLLLIVFGCYEYRVDQPWAALMIATQVLRVMAELANHRVLTADLGFSDRFWMVPFLLA